MELRTAADKNVGDLLFHLPRSAMSHRERLQLIKQAVADDRIREEDIDCVWTRLLEEMQRRP